MAPAGRDGPALDLGAMEGFLTFSVEQRGLGYCASFPTWDLRIEVDHLRRSRGELTAELAVHLGNRPGTFHWGRHNLSSATARGTLAKSLTERTAGQHPLIPWREVLERLAVTVAVGEREASPTVRVGLLPTAERPRWRVEPILPLGKPAILYGDYGSGKSYLALCLALAVETGQEIVPGWRPLMGSALYCDWESDAEEIDRRAKALLAGAGTDFVELRYRPCAAPLADMTEELAAEVAREAIGLLIIDSAGLASGTGHDGGDANESTLRLFAALRAIGTTSLLIDHITKSEANEPGRPSRPYGSIYKGALARSTFEVRRYQEADAAVMHLGLWHTKSNVGPLLRPQGLALHHEGAVVVVQREEIADELSARLTLAERIEKVLGPGPRKVSEIAEEMNEDVAKLRVTLHRGKGRRFYQHDAVTWSLLSARVQ